MAEGGVTVTGSEPVFDFYCEFCNENGQHLEAVGYCSECEEYLCGKCIDNHKGNRLSQHHAVLDKENMPRATPPSSNRVRKDITTMCKQHKGEPVKYFCKRHDKLTCCECIVTYHKTCPDIVNITQSSSSIFDDKEYKDFIQKLNTLQTQVHNIITKSREQIITSERCFDETIAAVRQFRDDIICILDDIEVRLEKEVDDIKTKDVAKMKSIENTSSTLQEKLDQTCFELDSFRSTNRVCQAYISMKEAEVHVKEIEKQLKSVEDKNTINIFSFIPNSKLIGLLRDLDAFGKITLNNTKHKKNQKIASVPTDISSPLHDSNVLAVDSNEDNMKQDAAPVPKAVSSASFMHDIDVRSISDRRVCWITGSVVLSDSRLLIVDQIFNKKIKLIDTQSRRLMSELNVSSSPWDVTVVTGDHVAVTVPKQNTILVLKVSDSIIKEREIRVKGQCHGIVYSKNQLIVSYLNPAKLEIMDVQGNVSVIMDKDKDGNKLFNEPLYICVSNDGDTIYVSDFGLNNLNKVISMSRKGTVKDIYTDSDLSCPRKLCIDHRGNLFVCGFSSQTVHMLTPDCTKIKVILTQTDGLTNLVHSVSHCSQTDKLFIGMINDKVKVYQLS